MKKLKLVLKKKWYDMILNGEKKEEYREIKDHYFNMFFNHDKNLFARDKEVFRSVNKFIVNELIYSLVNGNKAYIEKRDYQLQMRLKEYESVVFYLGYSKDRPTMEFEFKGIEVNRGNTRWGANRESFYFVIKLGNKIT